MDNKYNNFLKRVDLVQNQVERERLREQQAAKSRSKTIQQQNAQRFADYQRVLRAELEARWFASVMSTGGEAAGTSIDPDAQAFITAASITDPTQQTAINNLVTGFKTDGIWTKMKAIYPFVGGTASQHKFNLKNPLNTNAAFRLIFNGGWTHSANGVQGNGINNWMNTWFNPEVQFSSNYFSAHVSYYSRTNNTADYYLDFSGNIGGNLYAITFPDVGGTYFYGGFNSVIQNIISNTQGLFTVSMINDSSLYTYRNSTTVGSDLNTYDNAFISDLFTIGGSQAAGLYSPKQYAFATIGIGLTDTDVANLYSRIQAFQTTLGRQV